MRRLPQRLVVPAVAFAIVLAFGCLAMRTEPIAASAQNPATQRREMIRLLKSIDQRLGEIHGAFEKALERMPADKKK